MTINVGTLEQVITERGGDELLRKLGLIDAASAKLGAKTVTIGVIAPNATTVTQTLSGLGATGEQTGAKIAKGMADATSATERLSNEANETAAKLELLNQRFPLKTQSTDKNAAKEQAAAQRLINQEIATSTQRYQLFARTVDVGSAQAVGSMRQLAQEQLEYIQSLGATEVQQLRFAASVQDFEKRVERVGAVVPQVNARVRSGATAIASLAIAATSGGGSLAGMAAQAGMVGSVMAAEFAPARWAGYAAVIGAAVIAVTALVGIMKKLNEEAQKPRPDVLQKFADTRIPDQLAGDLDRTRKQQAELQKFILEAKRTGFLSTAGAGEMKRPVTPPAFDTQLGPTPKSLREAENRFKQAEATIAEGNKRLADITGDRSKEVQTAAIRGIVTAAEATKGVRLSQLAKEQAEVEKKFAEGTASLTEQYEVRRKAVVEGAKAERAALGAQREALLKALPGEDPKGAAAQGRRVEAGAVDSQIKALANDTAARLTALDAQRAAEEKALASKVLGYQVQLEMFSDDAFARRIEQIRTEDAERRKVLAQRGNATAEELAALDALKVKLEGALFLQKAQADLARLRADLETKLGGIENQRLAGLLSATEASRASVDIQRSAAPALQEAVDRAIQWAEKLGDQGVLGALKAIKAELAAPILLNIDIQTDAITKRLNEAMDRIQAAVNTGALTEADGRKMVASEEFGAGIASAIADSVAQGSVAAFQGKNPLQAVGKAMSSSLGSLLVEQGTQWLKATVFMKTIQTAMAALNPWVAAAAAVAMIALGSQLGGRGGGGGATSTFNAPGRDIVQHLWLDPDRRERESVASVPRAPMPSNPTPATPIMVTNNFTVIGEHDLRAQRTISNMVNRSIRAGRRLDGHTS